MKTQFFLIFFVFFFTKAFTQTITIFVSPLGNDLNEGSIVNPLKTLLKAKETILNHPQRLTSNFVVNLREGQYIQENTLAFKSADNIGVDKTITYQSYNNENVEITGGVSVQNWTKVSEKPYYVASVSNTNFRQFYTNNQRRQRASSGIIPVTDFISTQKNGYVVKRELLPFNYSKNDAEIHVMVAWKHAIIPIDSVVQKGGFSYLFSDKMKILESSGLNNTSLGTTYTEIVGALELLDEPGEWYCDKANNKIYYYPSIDENINNLNAVIPYTEKLVTIYGATSTNRVKNILFKNLKFSYSAFTLPNNTTFLAAQGSYIQLPTQDIVQGTIEINNAEDLVFENCKFEHLGATAIRTSYNTNRINISCNRFWDIGEAGVSVDTGDYITINNNLFYKTGAEILSACAIFATYPAFLTITNNEIRDVPYSGISVGWGWSTNPNRMRNNIIRGNRVFNYMRRLHDGGGIYTISRQDNSIIDSNYLFNSYSGQGSIYLDGGSSLFTVSNNVVDGSSLYWYSAFSTNSITVNNNFTNNSNNINQTSNSTFTNTNVFTNLSSNPGALSIFNNSGNQGNCIDRSVIEVDSSTPSIVVPSLYTVNLDENLIVKPKYVNLNYNNGSEGGNYTKWTMLSSGGGHITFESNYYGLQNVLAFSKAGSYSIKIELFNAFGLLSATTFSVNVTSTDLGENIAAKKPVVTGSILNNSTIPNYGNDNNTSTNWRSLNATKDVFYQIDLRGSYPIGRIELIRDSSISESSSRQYFWVQGSNYENFSDYVNLAYVNNETRTANIDFVWNLKADANSYRYIRIKSLRPEGFFNFSEFKIFYNSNSVISNDINTNKSSSVSLGIGTKFIDKAAILELKSNNSGFLMPRLNYNDIISIASPANGLLVFCNDCSPKCFFEATQGRWKKQIIGLPLPSIATGVIPPTFGSKIGIGSQAPFSIFQLNSTNQGVLFPRIQKLIDLVNPAEGLVVNCVQCTNASNYIFNGKSWEPFLLGSDDQTLSSLKNLGGSIYGINTPIPDPSAILDINSLNKGVLLPRLTNLELNQISSSDSNLTSGILVYCTDCQPKGLYFSNDNLWYSMLTKPSNPFDVFATRNTAANSALVYFKVNEQYYTGNVNYTAVAYLNGIEVSSATSNLSPIAINNLIAGEMYTFSVFASTSSLVSDTVNAVNNVVPGDSIDMSNLLLDQIAAPSSLVYSLRKLKSAYSGPCIKVRRTIDNSELDVSFDISGSLDVFSLLKFVGSSSGFVTVWYDQSGNAKHLTQTNQAFQMRIVKDGVLDANGKKPALFSSGANTLMSNPAIGAIGLGNSNKALNAVVTRITSDMAITIGDPNSSKASFWMIAQGWGTYLPLINGGEIITGALPSYVPQSLTIRHLNGITQGFQNTVQKGSRTQSINTVNNDGIKIGKSVYNHNSYGWFFEVIFFNGDLSDSNRLLLENNQIGYYK